MIKLARTAVILLATAVFPGARPEVAAQEVQRMAVPAHRSQPASAVAYRHSDHQLDSAMRFVAQTVTEDSHRITKPTYRVNVSDFCTLRFDRLDAGGSRISVHVVNLSHLDPEESDQFERMICFEAKSLENKIAYYELPIDAGNGSPIQGSRASKERFCFYAARSHSHRVGQAVSFAMDACGARSGW